MPKTVVNFIRNVLNKRITTYNTAKNSFSCNYKVTKNQRQLVEDYLKVEGGVIVEVDGVQWRVYVDVLWSSQMAIYLHGHHENL